MVISLLAMKLRVPPAPPSLVHRERLLALLDAGVGRKLTVVCAPAGYGKTTLLAEWASSSLSARCPVAWLSLDAEDNEPFRFWSHLLAALGGLRDGAPPGDGADVTAAQLSEPALMTLIDEAVIDLHEDFVLILDDYHAIHAPQIHRTITSLLHYSPVHMHIVIAGREEPPLSLPLWRARDQLAEVRAADLRFTPAEAEIFVRLRTAAGLPAEALEALQTRTEGWVAGLQLVTLSLREQDDAGAFIANLTGSHRYIADFLIEEVLRRQPEPVRAFLLHTSVLDRMCAPLCDRLMQRVRPAAEPSPEAQENTPEAARSEFASAQQILEYLERANLFVVPLDDVRHWYRYHHLFSDVLRDRLGDTHPDRVRELHQSAAEWYASNGYPEQALNQWLVAGDAASAARLVERRAGELLAQGEVPVLLNWLSKLPEAEIHANPWLCVDYAMALSLAGQPQRGEPFLASAERCVRAEDTPRARAIHGYIASLRAEIAAQALRIPEALEQVRRALEGVPEENLSVRSLITNTLGNARFLDADAGGADEAFARAVEFSQAGGNFCITVGAVCARARVRVLQGRLHEAGRFFQDARQLARKTGGNERCILDYGTAWMADLMRERGELDAARQTVSEALDYFRKARSMEPMVLGYVVLARIEQSAGDPEAAREALHKAQELALKYGPDWVTRQQLEACRVRVLIQTGHLRQATQSAETGQPDASGRARLLRHLRAITLARLALACGRLPEALERLACEQTEAEARGLRGSQIEILVLKSLALGGQGDYRSATQALEHALRLGAPEGYRRMFLDEGAPLTALLARLHDVRDPQVREYAGRLLAAFEAAAQGTPRRETPQAPSSVAVEGLTDRERDILLLIAEGDSYQDIAQRLVIAVSTVQHHIKSLYAKLDVHSGLEAVARARRSGLLP